VSEACRDRTRCPSCPYPRRGGGIRGGWWYSKGGASLAADPAFKVLSAMREVGGVVDSHQKTARAIAHAVQHALQPTLLAIASNTAHMASQMLEVQEAQSKVMQQLVAGSAVAAVDRGECNLRNLSAQVAAAEQIRPSRGLPPLHTRGQRLPPPPPATPVTAAVAAAAATTISAGTATTAAVPSAKRQRQGTPRPRMR